MQTAESFLLQSIQLNYVKISSGEKHVKFLDTKDEEDATAVAWQFCVQANELRFSVLVNNVEQIQYTKKYSVNNNIHDSEKSDLDDVKYCFIEGVLEDLPIGSICTLCWENTTLLRRVTEVKYRFVAVSHNTLLAAYGAARDYNAKHIHGLDTNAASIPLEQSREHSRLRNEVHESTHELLLQRLERAVNDIISIFMMQPDTPLHAGSCRELILALEDILRNGAKVSFSL